MSYWISEIYREVDDRTTGIRNLFCHVFADDVASMPTNDNDRVFTIGSVCDVVASGDKYMMNSSGNWILQPNASAWLNVYTKAEMDSILSGYQTLLTFGTSTSQDSTDSLTSGAIWSSVWSQILGVNTTKNLSQDIPEGGYDANTLTEPGIYRVPSAAVAGQVANLPQIAAGRLITMNLGLGNRYVQIWVAAGARFFMRSYISTGWQSWYEYAGTQVV